MWHVPVDHKWFDKINQAQWLWYHYNFSKDITDELELSKGMLEYHAWFANPEMVNAVQGNYGDEDEQDDSDGAFERGVEGMFGRKIEQGHTVNSSMEIQDVGKILDGINFIDEDRRTVEREIVPYNYSKWTNFDLE